MSNVKVALEAIWDFPDILKSAMKTKVGIASYWHSVNHAFNKAIIFFLTKTMKMKIKLKIKDI